MRLGFVSTLRDGGWGGSEELWSAAALAAVRRGIAVSVLIPSPRSDHPKWQALRRAGVALFSLPPATAWNTALLEAAGRISWRLQHHLRESHAWRGFFATAPDVLLVNEGVSIPAADLIERVERARIPYVVISHGNLGEVIEEAKRFQAARFFTAARAVLFVSEANHKATERQLLMRLPEPRVVRNPVNLASLDPLEWPADTCTALASVGLFHIRTKGQDILLEALSAPQWRQRNWTLSFYGTGRDEAYLRGLAAHYGIAERVFFPGHTGDIRAVWRSHHALALPSRAEGLPLVLVEAMLCGRPAIATAVAGHPEWIEEGRSGFLAAAATPGLYAESLERAWQRRAEWREIGLAARERALRLYDPHPGETLLAILLEAAAKAGSRQHPRQSDDGH